MPERGRGKEPDGQAAGRPTRRPGRQAAGKERAAAEGAPAAGREKAGPVFPIVGVGASAGGLAAIEEFFAALPDESGGGLAIVLVQHLDPDHESLLLDLVKRYTKMKVSWAEDGDKVMPGRVYVMPRNRDISLLGGRLVLMEPDAPRGLRLPIDHFFRSLAEDQRERAICVVLSGTGGDGAIGLRTVKGEGGLVIAQTPETAAYDGMPRSAIATGLVDYVLAPREIPEQLLGYIERAALRGERPAPARAAPSSDLLPQVLVLLRDRTGHDFSHYKASTVRRRVERRMAVTKVSAMADFVALLQRDSVEVETLFRELLIGVTTFFRDPDAFETLSLQVIAGLVARADSTTGVRVWVPGCSTGEEAYSIAILLHEQAQLVKRNVPFQVFATDIDAEAIERARAGVYPETISADVSPERLARFFIEDGSSYRVAKAVRDSLVFAKQDLIKDPPFSRIDLISCRNLLIYMDGDLQHRLMPLFHYALKQDGHLFLGTSETIGDATGLFSVVDKKWKIFRRRGTVTPRQLAQISTMPLFETLRTEQPPGTPAVAARVRVRDLAEHALLEHHSPSCVVINADAEILFIHGRTGRYLEPASGEPSGSLFKMAREGLRLELTAGVRKCLATQAPVRYERLHVRANGDSSIVNLTIEPLESPEPIKGVLMVLFEEVEEEPPAGVAVEAGDVDREQRIADLDRELAAKEEYLRTTIEELETTNEELKSTNEELQSSNEELQSTNEELETSKEELQSVNEELVTVNSELQQKIEELSQANNDMNNLLAGTGIGTLFVDRTMRIQRFTPATTQIIHLIQTDVGRPVGDIVSRLTGDVDLVSAVRSVLDTLTTIETEVETEDDRTFLMRVQPYRTLDNVIEGAVLTFVDVSAQRRLKQRLEELVVAESEARDLAESVVDTMLEPILVLDGELRVVTASRAFLEAFDLVSDDVAGKQLDEVDDGAWADPEFVRLLERVLPDRRRLTSQSVELGGTHPAGRTVVVDAVEALRDAERRRLIVLTVTDAGETGS